MNYYEENEVWGERIIDERMTITEKDVYLDDLDELLNLDIQKYHHSPSMLQVCVNVFVC